jgi:cell division inhibitor SulA
MSELICPFCQKELRPLAIGWCCDCGLCADKELWQRLIRTHKALDVAVEALKTVRRYTAINQFAPKSREAHIVAKKALAEITAEQKD